MQISIPYEKNKIDIEIPKRHIAGIFYPNNVEIPDESENIIYALANPYCSVPFDKFI